jgi:predicted nucleic acid-binding protein
MRYAFLNSSSEFESLRTALITSIIWFCLRCMTGTHYKQLLQIGSVGQTEADKIVATALDCVCILLRDDQFHRRRAKILRT